MSLKKILLLRSTFGFFGAESVVLEIAKGLASSNYKPIVGVFYNDYNPHIELVDLAKENNIETEIFYCRAQFDINTVKSLKRFVRTQQISLINPHGYKADFYAFAVKKMTRVPVVASCHPWIKVSARVKFYAWLDKLLLNKFDSVTTVSSVERNEIIQKGVDPKKITNIDNGIDIQRFSNNFNITELKKKYGIKTNHKVIGTVGRLSEEKGHSILFNSIKMLIKDYPDLSVVIVGDGSIKNELFAKVQGLGLTDHIIFTGICNNIPSILSIFDVFVLPSLSEGMPMSLLEAMAARKPIVATNVGDISSVIINEKTGLLIPPNDAKELYKAFTNLLSNHKFANNLAKQGLEKIKKDYSSQKMVQEYLKVFDSVLIK